MIKINSKKGELTTQQIVLLIILIMSFAVILYFLFQLNLGKESEKEICHNSVIMRGNVGLVQDSISLNCQREYICIAKKGNCGMVNPVVEKVENLDEIYEVLANKMADCWWMFGEGKIDYVGKDLFIKDNYCSICSQIAFDDSLNDFEGIENNQISKDELYDYMSQNKISNSEETYTEYLFGTNDLEELKRQSSEDESASFGTIDLGEQYFSVMGITSELKGRVWKVVAGTGIAVVGLFAGYTWAGLIAGAIVYTASEVGEYFPPEIIAITVEGDGINNEFMAPTIIEANSDKFEALNCYDINTLA